MIFCPGLDSKLHTAIFFSVKLDIQNLEKDNIEFNTIIDVLILKEFNSSIDQNEIFIYRAIIRLYLKLIEFNEKKIIHYKKIKIGKYIFKS